MSHIQQNGKSWGPFFFGTKIKIQSHIPLQVPAAVRVQCPCFFWYDYVDPSGVDFARTWTLHASCDNRHYEQFRPWGLEFEALSYILSFLLRRFGLCDNAESKNSYRQTWYKLIGFMWWSSLWLIVWNSIHIYADVFQALYPYDFDSD